MIDGKTKVKAWGGISLALVAVLFAAFCFTGAFASTLDIVSPSNVILFPCNNSSQMSVTWWDSENAGSGQVQYAANADLNNALTVDATATVAADSSYGYSAFEATMTNLAANTKYYYRVGHGNTWSPTYSFTTAPANAESFNFLYLGDVQYTNCLLYTSPSPRDS